MSIIQARALKAESVGLHSSNLKDSNSYSRASNRYHHDSEKVNQKGEKKAFMGLVNEACNLCDEKHPNASSDFMQCKKFLLMPEKQRCELVRRKKMCLQCLNAKTKWNDAEHSCSDKWICRHSAHAKY